MLGHMLDASSGWTLYSRTGKNIERTRFFSEEGNGYSGRQTAPIAGIECSGLYCDNKRLVVVREGNTAPVLNSAFWTSWFANDGTSSTSCPDDMLVNELQCSGHYCDRIRLQCGRLHGDYRIDATDKKYANWFSEEEGERLCPNGYYLFGMQCRGHYCDGIKLTCVRVEHKPKVVSSVCNAKRVKIYKFCINGDNDGGAYGEHQIRLDGQKYYPHNANDCTQSPSGFCEWREGLCHRLDNAAWKSIDHAKSITVGTEEHDSTSENDSYSAFLAATEWHNPTCERYEVGIAKPFKPEMSKSICWEAGVSATGGKGGVEGELSGGVKSCSGWEQPAESFVWFLTVEPDV